MRKLRAQACKTWQIISLLQEAALFTLPLISLQIALEVLHMSCKTCSQEDCYDNFVMYDSFTVMNVWRREAGNTA